MWKTYDVRSGGEIPSGPPSLLSAMNRDQKGCSLALGTLSDLSLINTTVPRANSCRKLFMVNSQPEE